MVLERGPPRTQTDTCARRARGCQLFPRRSRQTRRTPHTGVSTVIREHKLGRPDAQTSTSCECTAHRCLFRCGTLQAPRPGLNNVGTFNISSTSCKLDPCARQQHVFGKTVPMDSTSAWVCKANARNPPANLTCVCKLACFSVQCCVVVVLVHGTCTVTG